MTIKESADLALNNYTRYNDPTLHNIPYFYVSFRKDGAVASHCEWDFGDATGRYLDSLVLCKEITGMDETEVEEQYFDALKWMISLGDDGLCYRPKGPDWAYCANTFDQRSALLGLISYYKKTGRVEAMDMIKGVVNGLISIGVDMGDYFYMPYAYYTPDKIIERKHYDMVNNQADPCHYGGGVHLHPLMLYHGLTGDNKILELCGKIARFVVRYGGVYQDDGSFFTTGYFAGEDGHFHSRTATVTGVMMYAAKTGDTEMMRWCKKVYDFAKKQGTSYGFFPEALGKKPIAGRPEEYPEGVRHSEICCTTDMIEIGVLLSHYLEDCWDDVERFHNHLLKSQLTDVSWVKESAGDEDCRRDIPARYLGSFTGRTMPNDLLNNGVYDNMGCCTAAGGRGLWVLWDEALRRDGESTVLNLWLTLDNHCGRVECGPGLLRVSVAEHSCLKIRIPEYLKTADWTINRDDYNIVDGYIVLPEVKSHDPVEIKYNREPCEKKETLNGEILTVTWQGSAVLKVEPIGTHIPLYPLD